MSFPVGAVLASVVSAMPPVVGVGAAGLLAAAVGYGVDRAHVAGWYRHPGDPPPHRPAAVPVLVGLWVLLALRPWTSLSTLDLALVATLVAAAGVDVAVRRLPDILTLSAGVTMLLLAASTCASTGSPDAGRALLWGAVTPAVALGVTLTVGGLGLGDVKMLCSIAALLAWHGLPHLVTGLVVCWSSAAVYATLVLIRSSLRPRAREGTTIPLGPHLLVGTVVGLLL